MKYENNLPHCVDGRLNPLQEVGVMKCWLREALLLLTCLLLLRTATTTGPPKDWRRGYFTRFPLKNQ